MPLEMQQTVLEADGIVVLRPVGALNPVSAGRFEHQIRDLLTEQRRWLVVDMAGVEQLSSASLRVLLITAQRLADLDGRLLLCAVSARLLEVLEIAGFGGRFQTAAHEDEAVRWIRQVEAGRLAAQAAAVLRGSSPVPAEEPPLGLTTVMPSDPAVVEVSAQAAEILAALPDFQLPPALDVAAGRAAPDHSEALRDTWRKARRLVNELLGS